MLRTREDFLKSLSPAQKSSLSEKTCEKILSLQEYKNSPLVLAYIPGEFEADCIPVILDAMKNNKKVLIPRTSARKIKEGRNEMEFYFLENGIPLETQLEKGSFGILEPKADLRMLDLSDNPPSENSLMIVPGLAFTKKGKRLGHGKGFYDIYIERMRESGVRAFLCGLCLPCQIMDDLPAEEHDALMDKVIYFGESLL